jgi:sugar phosphate isomerase/epimerase
MTEQITRRRLLQQTGLTAACGAWLPTTVASGSVADAPGSVHSFPTGPVVADERSRQSDVRRPDSWRLAAEPGLLNASAGGNIVAQMQRAVVLGFDGWSDPEWGFRSAAHRNQVVRASVTTGLRLLSVSQAVEPNQQSPLRDVEADVTLPPHTARRVLLPGDFWTLPSRKRQWQWDRLVEQMLQISARQGQQWLIDATPRLIDDVDAVERAAQSVIEQGTPYVRLATDLYHWATMGFDPIDVVLRWGLAAGQFELADWPGGGEPGTGQIDWLRLRAELQRSAANVILGMRHGCSRPGRVGEAAMLRAYRAWGLSMSSTVAETA